MAYNPRTKFDWESPDELVFLDEAFQTERPSWSDAPPSLIEDIAALNEEE